MFLFLFLLELLLLLSLSFLLQKLGIVVVVCTDDDDDDDDDDDRDKDKDEANESINPSAVILESAHLLGRLKRPHRCSIFFYFEGSSEIQKNSFHTLVQTKNSYTHREVVLTSSLKII